MKQYKTIENNIKYNIIEYLNGDKYWYYKGKCHRENGPAFINHLKNQYIGCIEQHYYLNEIRYYDVDCIEKLQIEVNNLIIKEIIE